MNTELLLVHAAATWFMVGLIWIIQIVHYPLMARVGAEQATPYAAEHQRRISYIVGPVMLVEGVTAVWLLLEMTSFATALGVVLVALLWLITATVQVPLHARLASAPSRQLVGRLVRSNWSRTLLWTARGGLALFLASQA